MNERIQELHEEAMKSCDEHRSDTLNYHRIYREKFAELIVRECVTLCYNRAYAGTQGSLSDGAMLCANDIKEQFGVEE